jgi:hypothetical protein
MTTRKSTPATTVPTINSDELRISNKEVIDQEVAKEQEFDVIENAKEVKAPVLTLWEVMGIVIKQNPQGTAEQVMNKANQFYTKKTGKESNPEQLAKYYHFTSLILKGYNA